MPTTRSNSDNRILWSAVSKAADRSNSTRTEELPESVARSRLFCTLKRAISVPLAALKSDWNFSKMLFLVKWDCRCYCKIM